MIPLQVTVDGNKATLKGSENPETILRIYADHKKILKVEARMQNGLFLLL